MRHTKVLLTPLAFTLIAVSPITAFADASEPCPQSDSLCISGGWTDEQRKEWYYKDQGSQLIPEDWAKHLRTRDGDRFFARENFAKYGYIWSNNEAYPIGFTVGADSDGKVRWLGMTCAACHTSEIEYGGQTFRIDGAGALSDFQSLMRDLEATVTETRDDEELWDAFVRSATGNGMDSPGASELAEKVDSWRAYRKAILDRNETPVEYGHGRLDAIGHIFNKVAHTLDPTQPANFPSDAPVSYPYIWNTRQQQHLQWNGMVSRGSVLFADTDDEIDLSGIGRNTGQVIGVHGGITLKSGPGSFTPPHLETFVERSSIRVDNLIKLEAILADLESPRWPEVFGAVDTSPVALARGRRLFAQSCSGCHDDLESDDLTSAATVELQNIFEFGAGTDPWMACNAAMHETQTGVLKGEPLMFGTGPDAEDQLVESVEPTSKMLRGLVSRVMGKSSGDIAAAVAVSTARRAGDRLRSLFGSRLLGGLLTEETEEPFAAPSIEVLTPLEALSDRKRAQLDECKRLQAEDANAKSLLKYKARPLNGIWATAPYLHNGSVPTLRDLLAAPEDRPRRFHVGSRRFDPVNVGFATDRIAGETTFEYEVDFTYKPDTVAQTRVIPGNDNYGHDYGAFCRGSSSPIGEESEDCRALLLYLKSL